VFAVADSDAPIFFFIGVVGFFLSVWFLVWFISTLNAIKRGIEQLGGRLDNLVDHFEAQEEDEEDEEDEEEDEDEPPPRHPKSKRFRDS
jgi:hypothetical protein